MSKVKVSELAEQLGVSTAEVMESAKKLGEAPKSASSTLEDAIAAKIRASFLLRRMTPEEKAEAQKPQIQSKGNNLSTDSGKEKSGVTKAASLEAVEAAKAAEAAMLAMKEAKSKKLEPIEKIATPEITKKEAAKIPAKKPLPDSLLKDIKPKKELPENLAAELKVKQAKKDEEKLEKPVKKIQEHPVEETQAQEPIHKPRHEVKEASAEPIAEEPKHHKAEPKHKEPEHKPDTHTTHTPAEKPKHEVPEKLKHAPAEKPAHETHDKPKFEVPDRVKHESERPKDRPPRHEFEKPKHTGDRPPRPEGDRRPPSDKPKQFGDKPRFEPRKFDGNRPPPPRTDRPREDFRPDNRPFRPSVDENPLDKIRFEPRNTTKPDIQMPKRVEPVKLPPLPPQKKSPPPPTNNFHRGPRKPIVPIVEPPVKKPDGSKWDKEKDKNKDIPSTPYIVEKEHFAFKKIQHKHHSSRQQQSKQPVKPVEVKPQKLTIEVFAKTAGVPEQRVMAYMLKQGYIPNPEEELTGDILAMISSVFGLKTSGEGKLSTDGLVPRTPIVTIMGHVDHGKTTLLDYIRKTQVAAGEAGGITQSIGAYKVSVSGRDIVFIDTPGHEAFATMRREGANVTDIVVLVIAADEGVKEQTIEALNMAREAKVPIMVAANKMDRPGANLDKLRSQIAELGLTPEDWGGETMVVPIVAKTGDGISDLLERILLFSDILELKTSKAGKLAGTVIESHMDRFVGPLATAIIQSGTIKVGDYVEAGNAWGRIKALYDHVGNKISKANSITPIKIMGFDMVPKPGSILLSSDQSRRRKQEKGPVLEVKQIPQTTNEPASNLDDLFKAYDQMGQTKLNVVVKAESEGSLDAVKFALSKIKVKDIPANIVYSGIGIVSDNDVLLAEASKAFLVGFNVQVDTNAKKIAKQKSVPIQTFNIIFELTDAVTDAIKLLVAPEFRDIKVGAAEVRQVFNISDVGNIAGCMVTEGYVNEKVKVKVVRNRLPIYETKISSLKRFKEDTHEVKAGYECGIGLENFDDLKQGDILEFYTVQQQEVV